MRNTVWNIRPPIPIPMKREIEAGQSSKGLKKELHHWSCIKVDYIATLLFIIPEYSTNLISLRTQDA